MLLEIDHHSGVPIYRQVIDQVRRQIMTGLLAETDQLETVRELAARLNVVIEKDLTGCAAGCFITGMCSAATASELTCRAA